MKSRIIKIVAVCLGVLILTSGTVYALAANSEAGQDAKAAKAAAEAKPEEAAEDSGIVKDETVYVLANADGSVKKIIVSDWIKNTLSSQKINDVTELNNAENIKGGESYTMGGNGILVWDADGNDIYYQGVIQKELPVGISVSYKLDGQPISPEELAGKSGKVTIRFDYDNNQYETVSIDGKDETIYVPFVILTGMLLNNDTFKNIEVSNGRLLNDGDRTAVIGFALPGLQENLGIDKEDFEIPSYVEVTADVTDFSLGITVTMATNSLFNELDADDIDTISDLADSMDELNDAMEELMDGSSALYDGLSTLLVKSSELVDGVAQIAEGAGQLMDGAHAVDGGAKELADGAAALSAGLNKLSASSSELNGGAKQVFKALLSNTETQLKAAGLPIPELTIDNYASVLNSVIAQLGGSDAAKTVAALKASLDEYNKFYQGLKDYTGGVDQAATGAAQLNNGAAELKRGTGSLSSGASQLYDGILTMKNSTPALVNGIEKLKDGAMQLSDGLAEFNEKGIQKLIDYVDDAEELIDRLKATIDVSKNYKSFAGISDGASGNVKFVYRTDEIE